MCYEVSIWRRPGDRRGPPSVAPVGVRLRYNVRTGYDTSIPYHEWVNAVQDYEERGTPLPPWITPSEPRGEYLRPDGTPTTCSIPALPTRRPGDPLPWRLDPTRPGIHWIRGRPTDSIPPPREVPAKP